MLKPMYIRLAVMLVLVAGIAGYSYFKTRDLIAGPRITITEPSNGALLAQSPLLTVAGTAEHTSLLTLNDREIFIDETGAFQAQLLLPEGYTILTVKALDTLGRTTSRTLHLTHQ